MVKLVIKAFAGLAVALCILEVFLRIAGVISFALHPKPGPGAGKSAADGSFTINFIGDSWTEGADAPRGQSYADVLVRRLQKEYPGTMFRSNNYGRGSYNSAEASIEFIKHYKADAPAVQVVLTGINNAWNVEDVDLAAAYFNRELGTEAISRPARSLAGRLIAGIQHLKIVRLARLIHFNVFTARQKLDGPHPMNAYVAPYFQISSPEAAREHLIANLEKASSYDDFYQIMLYSFDYDLPVVEKYLREKGVWRPSEIKYRIDPARRSKYKSKRFVFLEEHLKGLKALCDDAGIILVMQTYPYFNPYTDELNDTLRQIARANNIHLVDQHALFTAKLSKESWIRISTGAHINAEGYALMADNLATYIKKKGLIAGNQGR